jgi:hypothetical protein
VAVDHHGTEIPASIRTKRELWQMVVRQGGRADISNAGHAALDAERHARGHLDYVLPGWSATPKKDQLVD